MISENKTVKIGHMTIDNMLLNLITDCYKVEYADIASHFLQLATQTFHSEANIMGPLKPPTGKTIRNRLTGKYIQICKKVDEPQPVDVSIWVVRGFYPETGIPFKMTCWQQSQTGNPFGMSGISGCKITLGAFGDKTNKATINVDAIGKYTQEVAERIILDQPIEDLVKPKNIYEQTFRCMTPKGIPKHENKIKKERSKCLQRANKKSKTQNKMSLQLNENTSTF